MKFYTHKKYIPTYCKVSNIFANWLIGIPNWIAIMGKIRYKANAIN